MFINAFFGFIFVKEGGYPDLLIPKDHKEGIEPTNRQTDIAYI